MSRTPRTYWAAGTAVLLALLFAAAATVAAASGDPDTADRTPALHSADAGFARDMAVHHQQAVEMSFVVRDRTQDEAVRTLAYDIANTQANQRGMLLGWLDLWELPKVVAGEPPMTWMAPSEGSGGHGGHGGHGAAKPGALMSGMATKEEIAQLGAASGRDAEVLYLQLMTDHHVGGVAMARGCADQCVTPAERDLSRGMVAAQQSELTLMADMLKQRGAAPRG
ncbi:DUF305 domain-containing protein [Streptomyces antarcticus]|uniref:DUF305 domain-containing protein n=1 Tax=Streptomyces antarcticus TaxID=2996458 RepID=UPI0022714B7B|nr:MULTISPECIES: DUF305 domain-containing protein [unclassified Streptomyces]MCY0942581.1 DUF305 domain-containing protein [Streptomyces sp. H34-AA3]MCZ4087731.1 DUF305 domain-containing protein [Streptomyces sp. H34-S5]